MHPFWWLVGSYVVAESYERLTTPEQKTKWKSLVKSHHGEWGVAATLLGIAARSPALKFSGMGLALHDRKDVNKWFRQDGH